MSDKAKVAAIAIALTAVAGSVAVFRNTDSCTVSPINGMTDEAYATRKQAYSDALENGTKLKLNKEDGYLSIPELIEITNNELTCESTFLNVKGNQGIRNGIIELLTTDE